MARLVRKEDKDPMRVKVGSETKWICMSGLGKPGVLRRLAHKDLG